MTPEKIKQYLIGVLKGWFPNKATLDKLGESNTGKLTYNGTEIGSATTEDWDVATAITETLAELNNTGDA